jgi:hypothetical protein
MKLSMSSTIMLGLATFTSTVTAETTKYSYKENSNQAYSSSYWRVDPCLDYNSFTMYATDGFVKNDGKKEIIKYLNGDASIYSDCQSNSATLTTFNFYSTENLSGLVVTPLTNATMRTNVTAYFTKSACAVESYDYPAQDSNPISYSYYVCGEGYESGTKALTIDTVMKLATGDVLSKVYSSNTRGVTHAPGYLEKYETKSKCKTAVATKNTLKWGKKTTIIIPTTDFAEICKVSSGFSERISF